MEVTQTENETDNSPRSHGEHGEVGDRFGLELHAVMKSENALFLRVLCASVVISLFTLNSKTVPWLLRLKIPDRLDRTATSQ